VTRRRQSPHGEAEVRGRSVSPAQKRGREDEWKEAKSKKNVRKTALGTSKVDLSSIGAAQGLAGPVQFYIGNTTAKADEDTIKTVLDACAKSLEFRDKFEVVDIELLTKEDNPRTKCWRVAVPYHCKILMENPEMFPPGWRTRRFFSARTSVSDKRRRVHEQSVVDTVLAQQKQSKEILQRQENERQELATGSQHIQCSAGSSLSVSQW
jgi:hypothetical protein